MLASLPTPRWLRYKIQASNKDAFYDVTVGNNACGDMVCCPLGYTATPGWDAVSGLGTVGSFEVLRKAAVAMG